MILTVHEDNNINLRTCVQRNVTFSHNSFFFSFGLIISFEDFCYISLYFPLLNQVIFFILRSFECCHQNYLLHRRPDFPQIKRIELESVSQSGLSICIANFHKTNKLTSQNEFDIEILFCNFTLNMIPSKEEQGKSHMTITQLFVLLKSVHFATINNIRACVQAKFIYIVLPDF